MSQMFKPTQVDQAVETTAKSIEQIDNPILQILLIVLVVIIGYMIYRDHRKDKQIKEINALLINTIKEDVDTIQELKSTFDHSAEQSRGVSAVLSRLEAVTNKVELKLDYLLNFKK